MFRSVDPSTGKQHERFETHTEADVDRRLMEARDAFLEWSRWDVLSRVPLFRELARLLEDQREDHAHRIVKEMGKPVTEARGEVDKCARLCLYFADHAPRMLAPQPDSSLPGKRYAAFLPLGPVLAVMPWNFPYWQVLRFAVPALIAGNGVVLKHAPNVPGCALAIERLFEEAGFPPMLVANLFIEEERVEEVIADPRIAGVTLTGSPEAGRSVAQAAGRHLKKSVLELGGSDPYLVLADSDLDKTEELCVKSRLVNTGQSCIAAKRFIAVDEVHDEFQERVVAAMGASVMGDPGQEETDLGPLARGDLRRRLHEQVTRSVDQGARLLLGGEIPDGPGYYYPPTVLADVTPGMPAFDEELFGPVAALVRARDEEEAIRLANRSRYGLGAAVFTRDLDRGEQIARDRLEAGACFVNDYVRSDPRMPFGGIKESGYGRELSYFGLWEFVNIKTVSVQEMP